MGKMEQDLSPRFRSLKFFDCDGRKFIFQELIFLLLLFMILIIINRVISDADSLIDVTMDAGVVPRRVNRFCIAHRM